MVFRFLGFNGRFVCAESKVQLLGTSARMNAWYRPLGARALKPLPPQLRVTMHLIHITTVGASLSNFVDIWTSSPANRRLFCCRAASRMKEIVEGETDAKEIDGALLEALDDWRWELCQLSAHSPASIVKLLTRALRTCVTPDFSPHEHIRRAQLGSAIALREAPNFYVGRDRVGVWRLPPATGRGLNSAHRSFQATLRRALSV